MNEPDDCATAENACAEVADPRTQDPPDVYDLLLVLAGRLDDDLLAWARELVAVGEEGQAVELVTAALAAERVMLPAAVRRAVVAAGRAAHTDLDVERELAPPVPDDVTVHRFDPAAASGDRVAGVLAGLPARRLAGCTLYLTWRSTPAGAAPGPVPRAVVLVEAGPDRSADVLAYLLATELDRAAVPASVEVFTTGTRLPAYHRTALAAARRIEVGASVIAPAGVVVARTAAEAAARAAAGPAGSARAARPASVDPTAATGGAEPTVPAEPGPGESAGRETGAAREAGRTDTAALFVVPSPDAFVPLPNAPRRAGRRRRLEAGAAADPAFAGDPSTATGAGSAVDAHRSVADPSRAGSADVAPDTDPFHDPLRVPLLAPLLDPTAPESDEPHYRPPDPTPIRPVPAQSAAGRTPETVPEARQVEPDATSRSRRADTRPADPPSDPGAGSAEPTLVEPDVPAGGQPHTDDQPSGATRPVTAVVAAGGPGAPGASAQDAPDAVGSDDVPREWQDDWQSGEWAMPPTAPPLPPAEHAEPAEAFDVFGTPTSHGTDENAAERTGRTPMPPRTVPEFPGSPLPHRGPPERHAGGPSGSGQPTDARPEPDPFGADPGRTLAQPPAGRTGPPADVSLFVDSPTARVNSPSRPPGPPLRPIPPSTAGDPRRPVPLDLPPAGSDDVPLFGEAPAPVRGVPDGPPPELPRTGRRRRPDPDEPEATPPPATDVESSLFNGTERDLLAQLQAELAARERRPRPYRRARTGAEPAVNGHGTNGHGVNGHGVDGHGVDEPEANGPGANGHETNGHGNRPPGDSPPPDVSG